MIIIEHMPDGNILFFHHNRENGKQTLDMFKMKPVPFSVKQAIHDMKKGGK
jgi:hypothetical protein